MRDERCVTAGRGLDFPAVDWVVQVDCPEDVAAYVHRVGRTARNETKGKSLLLLTPAELKMVEMLQQARVPLKKIQVAASASSSASCSSSCSFCCS